MSDEPTSPLSPLAQYPPQSSSKTSLAQGTQLGRPQEFYGFVAWITTSLAWILFLLWALLPDPWIQATGLVWYPNREWALLLPSYSIFLVLFTYFTYFSLAIAATPSFSDIRTLTDSFAYIPPLGADNPYIKDTISSDNAPEMYDIPISLVNRAMMGRRSRPKPGISGERSKTLSESEQ